MDPQPPVGGYFGIFDLGFPVGLDPDAASDRPTNVSADHKSPSKNLRRLPRNPPKRVLVEGDG